MAKTIEPISSFKRAAELVSQVRESRAPIYITQNGQAAAVLLDVESYEEQQYAFALLKMCLDGDKSIDDGRSKTLISRVGGFGHQHAAGQNIHSVVRYRRDPHACKHSETRSLV